MFANIFNIKRYAVNDGPGIRTTIFFKGCPLKCLWCHNPESQFPLIQNISKKYKINNKVFIKEESVGYKISLDNLIKEILKDKIFFEQSNGGVTFSGGEPLFQHDFLLEILQKCKDNNLHTCVDTCGYTDTEKLIDISKFTDLFLYDIKHLDSKRHKECTNVNNELIIHNLKELVKINKEIIIRFPLIENINDDKKNVEELAILIKSLNKKIELNILPYHSLGSEKYNNLSMINPLPNMKNMNKEKTIIIANYFKSKGITTTIN